MALVYGYFPGRFSGLGVAGLAVLRHVSRCVCVVLARMYALSLSYDYIVIGTVYTLYGASEARTLEKLRRRRKKAKTKGDSERCAVLPLTLPRFRFRPFFPFCFWPLLSSLGDLQFSVVLFPLVFCVSVGCGLVGWLDRPSSE